MILYIKQHESGYPLQVWTNLPINYSSHEGLYGCTGIKLFVYVSIDDNNKVFLALTDRNRILSIKEVDDQPLPTGNSAYKVVEAKDIVEAMVLIQKAIR